MNIEEIKTLLESAIASLFANQKDIFDFTSETGQTEWNLAHHCANEIHSLIPDYSCDLDVVKLNIDNKRPDIIFHSRGNHKSNFLVVEIKRDGNKTDIARDIQKIQSAWFGDRLHYQFGAVVNLMSNKTGLVEVFKNQ